MESPEVIELLRQAEAGDQELRFRALRALVDTDDRALRPALRALKECSPPLKALAVRVLTSIGGEPVALLMLSLLRWYPSLRGPAIEVIQKLKPVGLIKETLLKDQDYQMRILGLQLLESFGLNESLDDALERAFYDRNKNVKCAAMKTIATLKINSLYWTFFKALKEPDEWVVFYALSCIGKTRPEGSEDALVEFLDHPLWHIRSEAIQCLGELGTDRAISLLKDRLANSTEPRQRKTIIRTLISTGTGEPTEEFKTEAFNCLREGNIELRKQALRVLRLFRDRDTVEYLLDWGGSLDPLLLEYEEVKEEVFRTLINMNRPELLCEVVEKGNLGFRAKALGVATLGKIKYAGAIPLISKFLDSKERDIRRAAAKALYEIGTKDTIEPLRKALSDKDGHVRQWAIIGLVRMGIPTEEVIEFVLQEPYGNIREEAIKALMRREHFMKQWFGSLPDDIRLLVVRNLTEQDDVLSALEDPSEEVRRAALRRLAILNPEKAAELKEKIHPSDEVLDCILGLAFNKDNRDVCGGESYEN